MNNIPNLFVIGAPKSGTTAFVDSLNNHPDIFVPINKEPRFFDASVFYDYEVDYPIKNLEEYLSFYDGSDAEGKKYKVDGSVFNMYSEEAIKDILKLSPDAKFIIILRDPLSATKSMFSQRMKYLSTQMRETSDSFDECWKLIEEGERANDRGYPKGCRNKFIFRYDLLFSYEKYLPMLSNLIKEDNLYLAPYTDFKTNPDTFYKKIFNYLDINNNIGIENKVVNQSFQLKNTHRVKIIGFLSSNTFWLRRKIGLSGGPLKYIKSVLIGKAKKTSAVSTNSDNKVKYYFRDTYEYLAKLNIKV